MVEAWERDADHMSSFHMIGVAFKMVMAAIDQASIPPKDEV